MDFDQDKLIAGFRARRERLKVNRENDSVSPAKRVRGDVKAVEEAVVIEHERDMLRVLQDKDENKPGNQLKVPGKNIKRLGDAEGKTDSLLVPRDVKEVSRPPTSMPCSSDDVKDLSRPPTSMPCSSDDVKDLSRPPTSMPCSSDDAEVMPPVTASNRRARFAKLRDDLLNFEDESYKRFQSTKRSPQPKTNRFDNKKLAGPPREPIPEKKMKTEVLPENNDRSVGDDLSRGSCVQVNALVGQEREDKVRESTKYVSKLEFQVGCGGKSNTIKRPDEPVSKPPVPKHAVPQVQRAASSNKDASELAVADKIAVFGSRIEALTTPERRQWIASPSGKKRWEVGVHAAGSSKMASNNENGCIVSEPVDVNAVRARWEKASSGDGMPKLAMQTPQRSGNSKDEKAPTVLIDLNKVQESEKKNTNYVPVSHAAESPVELVPEKCDDEDVFNDLDESEEDDDVYNDDVERELNFSLTRDDNNNNDDDDDGGIEGDNYEIDDISDGEEEIVDAELEYLSPPGELTPQPPRYVDDDQYKTPKLMESKDDANRLQYSVSFYRREKRGKEQNEGMSKVVHSGEGEDVKVRGESVGGVKEERRVKDTLRSLHEEMMAQQNIIHQASQAINVCKSKEEFHDSLQEVEAERLLLISSAKRRSCLEEINRLKGLTSHQLVTGVRGTLRINDICLPLKQNLDTAEFVNYFVILINHRGRLSATEMLSPSFDKPAHSQSLQFTNSITVTDLSSDFNVNVEVFCLQVKRDRLLGENMLTPSKEKRNKERWTPMKLLKGGRNDGDKSANLTHYSSAGGPNAVRSPSFQSVGTVTLTIDNVRQATFTLNQIPYASQLYGTIQMKLNCQIEDCSSSVVDGFLTMFEDISGFGSWHRRWFVLQGSYLSYWKYPDDVKHKASMGSVDLGLCIDYEIKKAPRDACARMNTMMMTLVNSDEKRNSTSQTFLAADSKEEMVSWCGEFNKTLGILRSWQPQQRSSNNMYPSLDKDI